MSVTPETVRVKPATTGKDIDNTQVSVAGADVLRQVTVIGDPETGTSRAGVGATAPAADALGLTVRPVRKPGYDSGRIVLPAALGVVTSGDTWIDAIMLTSASDLEQLVIVRDGAGLPILNNFLVPPHQFVSLPCFGMKATGGISWVASGIVGQVVGEQ